MTNDWWDVCTDDKWLVGCLQWWQMIGGMSAMMTNDWWDVCIDDKWLVGCLHFVFMMLDFKNYRRQIYEMKLQEELNPNQTNHIIVKWLQSI